MRHQLLKSSWLNGMLRTLFLVTTLLLISPFSAEAQTPAAPAYTQQQIDQMLAPIALYPDQLVSQILMASTYPLEVVEAARWLHQPENAQLSGDQLVAALQQQPWDPSVKSLVNFPQVLSMMDDHLEWTEQLGDAFLAEQSGVMDSVQRLREMAQASGHLASTPQQSVEDENQAIVIQPTNPEVVYVPTYNPEVVYGNWPYPSYQPYYFAPSAAYYPGYYGATGLIGFGVGVALVGPLWGWNYWDWHNHRIDINNGRFAAINGGSPPNHPGVWQHDPAHRHGVPYGSPAVRTQFQGAANQARQNFRGYAAQTDNVARTNAPTLARGTAVNSYANSARTASASPARVQQFRPVLGNHPVLANRPVLSTPQRQTPVFESFSHGTDVQAESQRGAYSRATISQQSIRAAPVNRGGGGGGGGGRSGNARIR